MGNGVQWTSTLKPRDQTVSVMQLDWPWILLQYLNKWPQEDPSEQITTEWLEMFPDWIKIPQAQDVQLEPRHMWRPKPRTSCEAGRSNRVVKRGPAQLLRNVLQDSLSREARAPSAENRQQHLAADKRHTSSSHVWRYAWRQWSNNTSSGQWSSSTHQHVSSTHVKIVLVELPNDMSGGEWNDSHQRPSVRTVIFPPSATDHRQQCKESTWIKATIWAQTDLASEPAIHQETPVPGPYGKANAEHLGAPCKSLHHPVSVPLALWHSTEKRRTQATTLIALVRDPHLSTSNTTLGFSKKIQTLAEVSSTGSETVIFTQLELKLSMILQQRLWSMQPHVRVDQSLCSKSSGQ